MAKETRLCAFIIGLQLSGIIAQVNSANMTTALDSNAVLQCSFTNYGLKAKCIWTRNGLVLKLGDRLRFIEPGIVNDVINCTLLVTKVQAVDIGHYQCSIAGTSNKSTNTIIGFSAWLNIHESSVLDLGTSSSHIATYLVIAGCGVTIILLAVGAGCLYHQVTKRRIFTTSETDILSAKRDNDQRALKMAKVTPYDVCIPPRTHHNETVDIQGYLVPHQACSQLTALRQPAQYHENH